MIYFYYGKNRIAAKAEAKKLADSLLKKKPNASEFYVDSDNWSAGAFEGYMGGQGLFNNAYIVFLDGVLANEEAEKFILDRISEIGASPNVFVFVEGSARKEILEKIKKNAKAAQEFGEGAEGKAGAFGAGRDSDEFNIFSLSDAFGKKDKKNFWALYRKAVDDDIPLEEICGTVFWQLKSMILANECKSATEAGLKPFVFGKSKAYGKNYSAERLREMSSELVAIYHNAHRGLCDFETAFEKFVLSI